MDKSYIDRLKSDLEIAKKQLTLASSDAHRLLDALWSLGQDRGADTMRVIIGRMGSVQSVHSAIGDVLAQVPLSKKGNK